jgi:GH24 family phage-related lysozyme (muramidase)
MNSYHSLFSEFVDAPGSRNSLQGRERQLLESTGKIPRLDELEPLGTLPSVSERSVQLIIAFEVTSEEVYEKNYRKPIWPGGASGITIGIGYDIGYESSSKFSADWNGNTSVANITLLSSACQKTGSSAHALLASLQTIEIPFANANNVFRGKTLPTVINQTVFALPRSDDLPADCLGALVSLVYNRGASFSLDGDRYREMRAIRSDIEGGNLNDVPTQIRSMKRLWLGLPDMDGLVKRRELEATLFEEGLKVGL